MAVTQWSWKVAATLIKPSIKQYQVNSFEQNINTVDTDLKFQNDPKLQRALPKITHGTSQFVDNFSKQFLFKGIPNVCAFKVIYTVPWIAEVLEW